MAGVLQLEGSVIQEVNRCLGMFIVLQAFAEHVAPALGWKPNTEGPVQGDPV